jgi:hypothetical protein
VQSLVARQTQQIADTVRFTPTHDRVPAEPRVTADHNPCLRPPRTDLGHDALKLLNAAGRTVLVRWPQPRAQQVLTAEDVQRQIAIAPVVAMEEATFLLTVQRVVRGVKIQPDLSRRLGV